MDNNKPLESPYLLHSYLDQCAARMTDFDRHTPHDNLEIAPNLVGSDNQVLGNIAGELEDEADDDEETAHSRQNLTRHLAETAVGVREMSKQLGRARVKSKIKSVMIITKARDHQVIRHTRKLALYLMNTPRGDLKGQGMVVYVDSQLRTSKRFNVAGMREEYPHLFTPRPRSRSTSQQDLKDMSFSLASTSISPENNKFLHPDHNAHSKEEGQLRFWTPEMCTESPHLFDLVITLGGDGTVLFASWLFQTTVPPVLPFSLGSLGFLTNFDFTNCEKVVNGILDEGIRVNLRMRFTCTVYRSEYRKQDPNTEKARRPAVRRGETGEIIMRNIEGKGWDALEGNTPPTTTKEGKKRDKEIMCFTTRPVETFNVLNDLVVDRGPSPYVSMLELFGDENHLTTVQADGLCVSTPTGSTAYSLSAGGSLVHPEIPALLISPICAHTLSFRPMLLPDSMELRICVPFNSRSTAWASFDGRGRVELKQGDHIKVTASKYPCPTICADKQSSDWFQSLNRTLHWNERTRQKSFVVVEEGPDHAELKNTGEGENEEKEEYYDDDDDDDDDDDQYDIDENSEYGDQSMGSLSGPGRARPILSKSFTSAFEPSVLNGRGSPGRYATTTTQPKPQPVSLRHMYNPSEELRHRQSRSVSKERNSRSRQPSLDNVNENSTMGTPRSRMKQLSEDTQPPMSPTTSARAFGVYGEDASESEMSD
ncbi:hypothetical protein E3Q24_00461 [Wallemia mellicola]|uniref:ATP-NAD kinase n=1 Tax=Wallemia mellicola TaxID=1708541 RepID=A0AB38N5X8_9BASI|nr:hypothetical protein E3Q24_00461 [Wallemia mellicola]TIC71199.1 ATP-NAD kinase [Wallemia mellicola]